MLLLGLNESPHACHDSTGLGKPLMGLLGLGWAGRGGGELSPCHSSLPVPFPSQWGTAGDAGVSMELGAAVGTVLHLPPHQPSPDTGPSLGEEGVGERSLFLQSVACPALCFEVTCVIFLTYCPAVPAALFPPASSLWWLGYFSHDSLHLDVAVPCLCQSNPNFLL